MISHVRYPRNGLFITHPTLPPRLNCTINSTIPEPHFNHSRASILPSQSLNSTIPEPQYIIPQALTCMSPLGRRWVSSCLRWPAWERRHAGRQVSALHNAGLSQRPAHARQTAPARHRLTKRKHRVSIYLLL
jgi:hypothetical protein